MPQDRIRTTTVPAAAGTGRPQRAQNTSSQQDLTTSINNFETQLQAQQTQLTNEFNQVNASLQAYPLLLEQTTEVLGTLNTGDSTATTSDAIPTLTSGL